MDKATSTDREIGRVMATSGCVVLPGEFPNGGCLMDWGVIQLAPGRSGENKVSFRIADHDPLVLTYCSFREVR